MTHRTLAASAIIMAALALIAAAAFSARAENADPANSGAQYAWSENTGWLNAEPATGDGIQVQDTKVTGYLWGENIGWINLNCENRGTCLAASYGVTNDLLGNLGGYAWGENVGWISFSCNNTGDCDPAYGVHVDPATGAFSGYAWGENIGWIKFDHSQAASRIVTSWPDRDKDGCSDTEEGYPEPLDGGQRNPDSPWDFFDVPVPALTASTPNSPQSKAISITDVLAVIKYSGTLDNSGPNSGGVDYDTDLNANSVEDGVEYDRTASPDVSKPWQSGPPSGAVSIVDVLVVLAQSGTNCVPPP